MNLDAGLVNPCPEKEAPGSLLITWINLSPNMDK